MADKVTPQMWTEAAVAALARKYLLTPLACSLTSVQARLWPSMVMSGLQLEGWGECWSGFTRGVHSEDVCDWCGYGGQSVGTQTGARTHATVLTCHTTGCMHFLRRALDLFLPLIDWSAG